MSPPGHRRPVPEPAPAPKELGEIALRVRDFPRMVAFYRDVIALPLMSLGETSAFFNLGEGVAGHTRVLALFDRSGRQERPPDPVTTTVDHLAFAIRLADFEPERRRLESLGLRITLAQHAWVKWRSLYVKDPDGNPVELVCYDESVTGDRAE